MEFKLQDLIDIRMFQSLQDKLNEIYSFPSAILDLEGNILTATAWQDVCTKFHRVNPGAEKLCRESDSYISQHLSEANPAVTYRCPHGLVDNATPIIINGRHVGTFFTGQFFLEKPSVDFFKEQAGKYGFDEKMYLEAVEKVPVWSQSQLDSYLVFIKTFTEMLAGIGYKNLQDAESKKALSLSENKYRSLVNNLIEGVVILDFSGKILFSNPAVYTILGYSETDARQIEGTNMVEYLHPDSVPAAIDGLKQVLRGENILEEYQAFRKNGSIAWIQARRTKTYYEGQAADMVICHDITEKKQAEENIRESEEKFSAIFHRSPVSMTLTSVDDGIYQDVNEVFLRDTGFKREEVIGRTSEELGVFANLKDREKLIGDIKKHGKVYGMPFTARMKDGRLLDALISLNIISVGGKKYFLSAILDISARKKAEDALKESEARLTKAQEIAKVGNWELDLKSRKIWASEQAFIIYGLDHKTSEVPLKLVQSVVVEKYRPDLDKALMSVVSGKGSYTQEFQIIRPSDGELRDIRSMAELLMDENNRPVKYWAFCRTSPHLKKLKQN